MCDDYRGDDMNITMNDTISLMFSNELKDKILCDYLQTSIKLQSLENQIDIMRESDLLYSILQDEIEILTQYKLLLIEKLKKLDIIDIETEIKKLKNPYNDLYYY